MWTVCTAGTGHTCSHGGISCRRAAFVPMPGYGHPCIPGCGHSDGAAHGLPLRPFYNPVLCPINNHTSVICPYHYSSLHPCIQLVFHACVLMSMCARWILLLVMPRSFCLLVTFKGRFGDKWLGEWLSTALVLLLANNVCFPCLNPLMGFPNLYFHSSDSCKRRGQLDVLPGQGWLCSWGCLDTCESRWYCNILPVLIWTKPLGTIFSFFVNSCCHSMLWMRIWDGREVGKCGSCATFSWFVSGDYHVHWLTGFPHAWWLPG